MFLKALENRLEAGKSKEGNSEPLTIGWAGNDGGLEDSGINRGREN